MNVVYHFLLPFIGPYLEKFEKAILNATPHCRGTYIVKENSHRNTSDVKMITTSNCSDLISNLKKIFNIFLVGKVEL